MFLSACTLSQVLPRLLASLKVVSLKAQKLRQQRQPIVPTNPSGPGFQIDSVAKTQRKMGVALRCSWLVGWLVWN